MNVYVKVSWRDLFDLRANNRKLREVRSALTLWASDRAKAYEEVSDWGLGNRTNLSVEAEFDKSANLEEEESWLSAELNGLGVDVEVEWSFRGVIDRIREWKIPQKVPPTNQPTSQQ